MSEPELIWFDEEAPVDIADALALPIPEGGGRKPPPPRSPFALALAAIFRPAMEGMADALMQAFGEGLKQAQPAFDEAAGIIDAEARVIEEPPPHSGLLKPSLRPSRWVGTPVLPHLFTYEEEPMPTHQPLDWSRLSAELDPKGANAMKEPEPTGSEPEEEGADQAEYGGWARLASSMEAPEGAVILPEEASEGLRMPPAGTSFGEARLIPTQEVPTRTVWEPQGPNRHQRRAAQARQRRSTR